jgi:tRNA threonylcarbamoyladenosine biosynthesis protein TsaE
VEIRSSSPEETERIGSLLAARLVPGDVATLDGDLGAGKTTLVRGAARALGVTEPVTSPTFTIGHRYRGRVAVSHLDLYRLGAMSEGDWGALEPYFDDAVVFVEWPAVAAGWLPDPRVAVHLQHTDEGHRLITLESTEESLLAGFADAC